MPRSFILRATLVLSLLMIIAFPLYAYIYQYPSFTRLLKENVTGEAHRIASHLSLMIREDKKTLTRSAISDMFLTQIKEIEKDPHIIRIKVFSPSGEILYSTHAADIGTMNAEVYFQDMVSAHRPLAREIERGAPSLEKQVLSADVVETYVPIIRNGEMIGVFEVYYDITGENGKLRALLNRSSGILFLLASVLLITAVISIYKADEYLQKRDDAEQEKAKLIAELRNALDQVKKLSGFLPICSSCKQIRDDKGYWNQIEAYIKDHSEAVFTHSICPACAKKLYPEIYKDS